MDTQVQDVQCPFGHEWKVIREIGRGSYGSVYLIERKVGNVNIQSAMKIIRLPASEGEAESLMQRTGQSRVEVAEYYSRMAESLLPEIQLMSRLRGDSHIVSYEDHYMVNHDSGIGMDIYIRMEYLESLPRWIKTRTLSVRDVVQLGIQLCRALETCAQNKTVHRDIKPDNIFVAANGAFKLGDFGIAQHMDHYVEPEDRKLGSLNYIAPEVKRGEEFDERADIYGLGMVMYRMLNDGRIPFLPEEPLAYTEEQEERARQRRLSGEKLPKPAHAGDVLWTIIEKACAYHVSARYVHASEMRKALEAIASHPEMSIPLPSETRQQVRDKDTSPRTRSSGPNGTELRTHNPTATPKYVPTASEPDPPAEIPNSKKRSVLIIAIILVVLLAAAAAAFFLLGSKEPAMQVQLQNSGDHLVITVNGGTAPYQATFYSGERAVETLSFESNRIEVNSLVPGTSYSVEVTDHKSNSQRAEVSIAEKQFYDGSQFRMIDMTVYQCDRQALADSDLHQMMARGRAVPIPENSITLRNASMAVQTQCWHLIVYTMDAAETAKQAEVQLVLRLADGIVVGVKDEISLGGGSKVSEHLINLDSLFEKLWKSCGEWIPGKATLEMYIDRSFVGDTSFEFVTGDSQSED